MPVDLREDGEISTNGKVIWVNTKDGCIIRINCLEELFEKGKVDVKIDTKDMIDISIE